MVVLTEEPAAEDNRNMEYTYYFYSFGNYRLADRIQKTIEKKDYEGFMKYFRSPDNGYRYDLPDEIFVGSGEENNECLDVTVKENFLKITYSESEHG